ncbi:MAG: universal stress protein, partial [candidate division KSB1 bacterium]|nr:universal stress protein [candidate division KSB1 bacterium]
DDREFRRSLTKIFQEEGFLVNTAATGSQAGILLGKHDYPVIVLDLKLPEGSGLDLLHDIRQASPGSQVIVVTACSDAMIRRAVLAAGALDYLTKPVKRNTLLAAAQRALACRVRGGNSKGRRATMLTIKRILFPTDFSRCADQALDHALYLARQNRAELHMLHALVPLEYDVNNPGHHFPDPAALTARLEQIASDRMKAALAGRGVDDLQVIPVQRQGISIAPTILQYVEEQDIDLIVMGTHGRRGLGHLFLGSVAEEIVREAPCPVLTIRERREPRPVDAIRQILVPMDFSEHAREALRYAQHFAGSYGAHLHLLHVFESGALPPFYTGLELAGPEMTTDRKARVERALQQLREELTATGVPVITHLLEGYAAHDIVHFAGQQGIDLIVIATHGLTGFKHLLLGSVTEKVVRHAPCPVFTVKTFGKSLVQ